MSLSEDEGDFISADEDGFDEDLDKISPVAQNPCAQIQDTKVEAPTLEPTQAEPIASSVHLSEKEEVIKNPPETDDEDKNKTNKESLVENSGTNSDNEDDEEALAERIRERNLKIARKFSAEIAKNVKPSNPIPVKGRIELESEFTDNSGSETKSNCPPSHVPGHVPPPPTPALSSSFNSEEVLNSPTNNTSLYSWRVPNKAKPKPTDSPPNERSARTTLDRLSEKLSQSDKSLFERVAEDIKKVSIIPQSSAGSEGRTQSTDAANSSPIQLISDLGSTLGGWNWSSATKLLASASQVTSQVGSVIDSVVGVSQHLQPSNQQKSEHDDGCLNDVALKDQSSHA